MRRERERRGRRQRQDFLTLVRVDGGDGLHQQQTISVSVFNENKQQFEGRLDDQPILKRAQRERGARGREERERAESVPALVLGHARRTRLTIADRMQ